MLLCHDDELPHPDPPSSSNLGLSDLSVCLAARFVFVDSKSSVCNSNGADKQAKIINQVGQ